MNTYKHYSFDLWMTLIRSNPSFKTERNKYFHARYNRTGKSLEEVGQVFRNIDLMCNAINEKAGGNIHAEEMYLMAISMINDYNNSFDDIDVPSLYADMEQIVFQYMPVTYCSATQRTLQRIKENGNSTIGLLSNTGFIKGRTLRTVLQHLELDQYFDFLLFSDEANISKPNPAFFQLMLQNVQESWQGKGIAQHEIVHIGDNARADIGGASQAGIHSLLVNSNNQCISTLFN
jgi:putative hydrolase of the HAD superfamily